MMSKTKQLTSSNKNKFFFVFFDEFLVSLKVYLIWVFCFCLAFSHFHKRIQDGYYLCFGSSSLFFFEFYTKYDNPKKEKGKFSVKLIGYIERQNNYQGKNIRIFPGNFPEIFLVLSFIDIVVFKQTNGNLFFVNIFWITRFSNVIFPKRRKTKNIKNIENIIK